MIALTDTATTKVKELMDAEGAPELYLRVAVRPGGCSGLSYEMFFDTEKAADDVTESYGDIMVVVDRSEERRVGKECRCGWAAECGREKDDEGWRLDKVG